jgi:hypothetical protein
MKQFLLKLFLCKLIGDHKWTSAHEKGIKPTEEQLKKGAYGLAEYSTMYCDRCGHVSYLSKQMLCKYKDSE